MKKSEKIGQWAEIAVIAYWGSTAMRVILGDKLICSSINLIADALITEAFIKILVGFAEIFEDKKDSNEKD